MATADPSCAETVFRAYYVITDIQGCGLPDGHTRVKFLKDMVSALGLEPKTL
jgi:hypothetical protein